MAAAPFNYRYPKSVIDNTQDFIQFNVVKYARGIRPINVTKQEELTIFQQGNQPAPTVAVPYTIDNSVLIGGAAKGASQGSILLPIPSQLSDTNATNFGESSLNSFYAAALSRSLGVTDAVDPADFANKLGSLALTAATITQDPQVAGLIKLFTAQQAVNALGANISFEQLFARATGSIINPNMELLFNGPTLRQFKFQFKMTPRDQPEAQMCKNIIKAFKKHMAPSGRDKNFLTTPDIFELSYQGKAKDYLNRFKLCALTNMSVNYTGEGNYSTYSDGAPVSMIMDLAFQELSPVYQEDYDGDEGVGY